MTWKVTNAKYHTTTQMFLIRSYVAVHELRLELK